MVVNKVTLSKSDSNLRKHLLLTLSRAEDTAERKKVDKGVIFQRINERFEVSTLIIATGEHASKGAYFQAGILLKVGVQRGSTPLTFRRIFPEFADTQLNLSFFKSWTSLCKYILEQVPEDQAPLVWGKHSLEQILEIVKAQAQHRKSPLKVNDPILPTLKDLDAGSQAQVSDAGYEAKVSCAGYQSRVSDAKIQESLGAASPSYVEKRKLRSSATTNIATPIQDSSLNNYNEMKLELERSLNAAYQSYLEQKNVRAYSRTNTAAPLIDSSLNNTANPVLSSSRTVLSSSRNSYFRSSSLPHSKEKVLSQEQPAPYFQEKKLTLRDRIYRYLSTAGWPEEYDFGYLKEIYSYLDWIAANLIFNRPIGTKQLLLYGRDVTPISTLVFELLSKVLYIYNYNVITNDYTYAHDDYDLWLFFNEIYDLGGGFHFDRDLTSYAKQNLLRVLDGKECRLMAEGGRVFTKRKNIPNVWVSNNYSLKRIAPLNERFVHLQCESWVSDLRADRLISTLWGCIHRRLQQEYVTWDNAKNIPINHVVKDIPILK